MLCVFPLVIAFIVKCMRILVYVGNMCLLCIFAAVADGVSEIIICHTETHTHKTIADAAAAATVADADAVCFLIPLYTTPTQKQMSARRVCAMLCVYVT